jgi:hypothetical protein
MMSEAARCQAAESERESASRWSRRWSCPVHVKKNQNLICVIHTPVKSNFLDLRHGYPWVPTDQAHGHPRQVGPAYQKTRRPVCGPNRPSWQPTRPPEDLPEDPPDDLVHHDLKTWRTRQDKTSVDFAQSRSTGYGKMCNVD